MYDELEVVYYVFIYVIPKSMFKCEKKVMNYCDVQIYLNIFKYGYDKRYDIKKPNENKMN